MKRAALDRRVRWLAAPVALLLVLSPYGCGRGGGTGGTGGGEDRGAPPNPETGITILLAEGNPPDPRSCKRSKAAREDHVRWENRTSQTRTLTFQPGIWPFVETQAAIVIPPNSMSEWYTMKHDVHRAYTYHVEPPLEPGPPTEPDITSDP